MTMCCMYRTLSIKSSSMRRPEEYGLIQGNLVHQQYYLDTAKKASTKTRLYNMVTVQKIAVNKIIRRMETVLR